MPFPDNWVHLNFNTNLGFIEQGNSSI